MAFEKEGIPLHALKEKLIFKSHEELTSDEMEEINNEISNIGIEKLNQDYTNPVHRGMIIALLSLCEKDQLSPFYPLQDNPEHSSVEKITKLFEKDLIDAFALTSI
jgi:hypothetical protein